MDKVTTKEMIDIIDEDIKFALEIGDKEFVASMKQAKAKLLDAEYPTRNEEYAKLFGKQLIFLVTISSDYVTIKTMERDFWSGNHPLGHMPLLVSPEKDDDMTDLAFRAKGYPGNTMLAAKGYTTDGVPVYLWSYGNYKYEVEVKKVNFSDCHVFDASFNEAVDKFKERAINGLTMY